jgi:hypothetical protein
MSRTYRCGSGLGVHKSNSLRQRVNPAAFDARTTAESKENIWRG